MGCLLHWSPKFYNNVFLFVGIATLGTFAELWLVYSLGKSNVQMFVLLIVMGNFVFFIVDVQCTSIYRSLSYPFRSLYFSTLDWSKNWLIKGEMETLQLELDTSTWSSIFNSADDGHQSFSLKEKFDEWKPKILTLIRDYVKVFFLLLWGWQRGR